MPVRHISAGAKRAAVNTRRLNQESSPDAAHEARPAVQPDEARQALALLTNPSPGARGLAPMRTAAMQHLQHTVGNQGVQRLLSATPPRPGVAATSSAAARTPHLSEPGAGPLAVQRITFERSWGGALGGMVGRVDVDADTWIARFDELDRLLGEIKDRVPTGAKSKLRADYNRLSAFVEEYRDQQVRSGDRAAVGKRILDNLDAARALQKQLPANVRAPAKDTSPPAPTVPAKPVPAKPVVEEVQAPTKQPTMKSAEPPAKGSTKEQHEAALAGKKEQEKSRLFVKAQGVKELLERAETVGTARNDWKATWEGKWKPQAEKFKRVTEETGGTAGHIETVIESSTSEEELTLNVERLIKGLDRIADKVEADFESLFDEAELKRKTDEGVNFIDRQFKVLLGNSGNWNDKFGPSIHVPSDYRSVQSRIKQHFYSNYLGRPISPPPGGVRVPVGCTINVVVSSWKGKNFNITGGKRLGADRHRVFNIHVEFD